MNWKHVLFLCFYKHTLACAVHLCGNGKGSWVCTSGDNVLLRIRLQASGADRIPETRVRKALVLNPPPDGVSSWNVGVANA